MVRSPKFYWKVVSDSFGKFNENNIFTLAAALAYYTVFSLPPALLIILHSTSAFYNRQMIEDKIFGEIGNLVGNDGAEKLAVTINQLGLFDDEWWATIVGVGVLVFTSTTVFVSIQYSLNQIFNVKAKPKLGFVKLITDRLLSFALILVIAFVLVVSLVASALIQAFNDYLVELIPQLNWLLVNGTSIILPLIITSLLFTMMFKYLPDAVVPWRDASVGAIITALLFGLGKYFISFYIGNSNVANLYDAAGSILVMLVWVFYTAVIFYYGAVLTYCYSRAVNRGIKPASYAVRIIQKEIELDRRKLVNVVKDPDSRSK